MSFNEYLDLHVILLLKSHLTFPHTLRGCLHRFIIRLDVDLALCSYKVFSPFLSALVQQNTVRYFHASSITRICTWRLWLGTHKPIEMCVLSAMYIGTMVVFGADDDFSPENTHSMALSGKTCTGVQLNENAPVVAASFGLMKTRSLAAIHISHTHRHTHTHQITHPLHTKP